MVHSSVDCNMLFGILALQLDFISRDDLIVAMNAWVLEKSKPLGEILVAQGMLQSDTRELLDALVKRHLKQHGDDAEKSLAAVSSIGSARDELRTIVDPDIQASLAHVSLARKEHDPHATLPSTIGESTSAGTRFRLLRPHAKGGLGQVSVAIDEELHREVALKELQDHHADDPYSRSRFTLEAEITGGLEHPGIVPVYGLGQYADGRPFYAMRFIRGDSLKDAIERFHFNRLTASRWRPRSEPVPDAGQDKEAITRDVTTDEDAGACGSGLNEGERMLEFRKLLQRFIDVCNAVEYAHSRGVLHRDLKPGNIMLGKYGETLVVDWGLAKAMGRRSESEPVSEEPTLRPASGSGSAPTLAGAAIGTPAYMSPEQAAGRLDALGPQSDVYSLGATLYTVLTGEAPFTDSDVGTTLQKVSRGEFVPPRAIKPGLPPAVEAICLKAMSLKPSERYACPRDLADDVEHYLADEPVSAYREPWTARAGRWVRRHRAWGLSGAAALLVVSVVSVVAALLVNEQRKKATEEQTRAVRLAAEKGALAEQERKARDEAELARTQAQQARLQEDEARKQAEIVSKYLVRVFRIPDLSSFGRTITLPEMLDEAVIQLDQSAPVPPLVKAEVLNAIGQTYYSLGLIPKAIDVLERSRDLRVEHLGEDHEDSLTSQNNLAMAYQSSGQLAKALPLLEQTWDRRRVRLGEDNADTITSLNNLALAYGAAGNWAKAIPLLERALEQRRGTLGEDHPDALRSMVSLAHAYQAASDLDKAVPLFEHAVERLRASLGDDHPDTLTAMNNLGSAYFAVDKLPQAVSLIEQVLAGRRAKLGDDHPDTLMSMSNLAATYYATGQPAKAVPLFEQILERSRAKLGDDHPRTLTAMNNLAASYQAAGEMAKAVSLFEQTVERKRTKLEPDHPDTLMALNNLANAYREAGQPEKAIPLAEQTLERARTKLGEGHAIVLAVMNNLALAYKSAGQVDKAIPLYEQALEQWRMKLGPDHRDTLTAMGNLAAAYESTGAWDKAEPLRQLEVERARQVAPQSVQLAASFAAVAACQLKQQKYSEAESSCRECLAIAEKLLPDNWRVFDTKSILGGALAGQKKFEEAEPMLIEGYGGMKQREDTMPATGRNRLTEALQRLVDLYVAWGRPDEAARWTQKLKE